jgi:hypothetical protein
MPKLTESEIKRRTKKHNKGQPAHLTADDAVKEFSRDMAAPLDDWLDAPSDSDLVQSYVKPAMKTMQDMSTPEGLGDAALGAIPMGYVAKGARGIKPKFKLSDKGIEEVVRSAKINTPVPSDKPIAQASHTRTDEPLDFGDVPEYPVTPQAGDISLPASGGRKVDVSPADEMEAYDDVDSISDWDMDDLSGAVGRPTAGDVVPAGEVGILKKKKPETRTEILPPSDVPEPALPGGQGLWLQKESVPIHKTQLEDEVRHAAGMGSQASPSDFRMVIDHLDNVQGIMTKKAAEKAKTRESAANIKEYLQSKIEEGDAKEAARKAAKEAETQKSLSEIKAERAAEDAKVVSLNPRMNTDAQIDSLDIAGNVQKAKLQAAPDPKGAILEDDPVVARFVENNDYRALPERYRKSFQKLTDEIESQGYPKSVELQKKLDAYNQAQKKIDYALRGENLKGINRAPSDAAELQMSQNNWRYPEDKKVYEASLAKTDEKLSHLGNLKSIIADAKKSVDPKHNKRAVKIEERILKHAEDKKAKDAALDEELKRMLELLEDEK